MRSHSWLFGESVFVALRPHAALQQRCYQQKFQLERLLTLVGRELDLVCCLMGPLLQSYETETWRCHALYKKDFGSCMI